MFLHCNLFYVIYFTSLHTWSVVRQRLQLLSGKIMFVGSLMIATQAVCGGMLSLSVSVTIK